ncbi:MAG: tRNA (5-methylaminomethyl-2-thiouridine)(34)-methyltransferase MnmD [Bacteroidota bacterium]|nr:tRNA (5-methylaminomethyl-2-thiouridine)(34)-methyltransferase MnmD [Bacteroidota bacterium]
MKPNDARKIVLTADGSSTIYNPSLNQHYHSIHGAVQESNHVFMKMGFEAIQDSSAAGDNIVILEIGFGTGLNAFLVLKECLSDNCVNVNYESLEAFPLEEAEAAQLNYFSESEKEFFMRLHSSKWNKEEKIAGNFALLKNKIKLQDFIPVENKYDLIFFDAFSPEAQPELWTEEIFRKLYAGMKTKGILVTYCAKGQVRRNLIAAGFSVERLEGPPGKREMLRGGK